MVIKGVTIIGYCLLVVGTLLGVIIAYLYNPKISPYLNAHLKALLPIRKLKELNLDLLYLISAALWNIDAILCMTADVLLIFYSNTIPTTAIATVDTAAATNHTARVEAHRDSPDTNNSNNEAVSFIWIRIISILYEVNNWIQTLRINSICMRQSSNHFVPQW